MIVGAHNLTALALGATTIALGFAVVWCARAQLSVVSAFSVVWVALIAVPALRYATVESLAKERFFLATVTVNLVLLIGALARWSRAGRRIEEWLRDEQARLVSPGERFPVWFWATLSVSLGLFLIHASSMPQIPLVELIRGGDISANDLTVMREQANKLLPLPLPVKYLFYWNVRVLVPTLLVTIIIFGRRAAKLTLVPLVIGLSALTLEKSLPTFAVLSVGLALAAYRRASIVSRPIVVSMLVSFLIVSVLQMAMKYRDFRPGVAAPDVGRANDNNADLNTLSQQIDQNADGTVSSTELLTFPIRFLVHRVLTGPSDVAYAWFEYFPDISGGFLRGRSWSLRSRLDPSFQHPANLVGVYAYHAKDPEHYLKTAHAYAAFHADAWGNFGYAGVVVASIFAVVVLMLVDVAMASATTPLTAGAAGSAASILLTTLPGGGLQAVLVAQGLALALPLALVPLWIRRRRPR